jgi:hypothetical protein
MVDIEHINNDISFKYENTPCHCNTIIVTIIIIKAWDFPMLGTVPLCGFILFFLKPFGVDGKGTFLFLFLKNGF